MDFAFTDEQTLLAESVERFVEKDYGFEARQALAKSEAGFSAEHWSTFAELGWLGMSFAADDGGFGGGAVETMILAESFGRHLVLEPYLATVVLAGGALRSAGSKAQRERWLPGLIDGTTQAALAFAEPQARFSLSDVETTAARAGDGYVLSGHKAVVLNGPAADLFVVSARTSGNTRDANGITLFIVDANASGVSRREYPTVDGGRAAEIYLDAVSVGPDRVLGELDQGLSLLEQIIDEGIFAVGAEAVGCMEVLYKDTVEYCKNRKQFGQPIGKFQVLQHRMVDMFMEYEQSKSLMYTTAMRLDGDYNREVQAAISAFKVKIGRSGRFVGQSAIQLHGGMGMTDELNIGHYFKRLTAIDALFGNVDFHLKRFGRLTRA